jgi:hypothetical protein
MSGIKRATKTNQQRTPPRAVNDCIVTPISAESSSARSKTRERRSEPTRRTNKATAVSEEISKALVRHLATCNPKTVKFFQFAKRNPEIASSFRSDYRIIRNRYDYLTRLRSTDPEGFISLCQSHSIQPSAEVLSEIFSNILLQSPDSTKRSTFSSPDSEEPSFSTKTSSIKKNMSHLFDSAAKAANKSNYDDDDEELGKY